MPYFIKSENNTDAALVGQNPGFHGTEGPIRVSTDPNPAPLLRIHQLALGEIGIQSIDINGASQVGTTIAQATAADGLRSGTANMYIDPIYERENVRSIQLINFLIDFMISSIYSSIFWSILSSHEYCSPVKRTELPPLALNI